MKRSVLSSPAPLLSAHHALNRTTLLAGVRVLVARDAGLARIVDRHGSPPLWERRPGFATLVRIILEQQVSLASAAALFVRLEAELAGRVTPSSVLVTGRQGLQAMGLTRQKSSYVHALADHVASGALPLTTLARLSDERASELLTRVPGIGPWTASIYLLMALRRPDVWPVGDLALHRALTRLDHGSEKMSRAEVSAIADRWRPLRAVAARILWHGYLSEKPARPST